MGLCLFQGRKSSQVAALAGLAVLLARIEAILARLQFANHFDWLFNGMP